MGALRDSEGEFFIEYRLICSDSLTIFSFHYFFHLRASRLCGTGDATAGEGNLHATWQFATAGGTVATRVARLGDTIATTGGAVATAGGAVGIHSGAKESLGKVHGPH